MHFKYKILSIICLYTILSSQVFSQDLIKSVPIDHAVSFSTDDLGNVYLIRKDNSLIRYSSEGDSTGNFRSVQNGDLDRVDASNPLRVLLYYPTFSKIVLLDKMLSVKNELDLKKLNIFNVPAVGMSADGKIWIYDYANATLKKIDDQLNITTTGNDMRQESQTVPQPTALIEKDAKIYLCDAVNGVYTFDRFASYLNTLEIKGVNDLQIFGNKIVYRIGDNLKSYDIQSFTEQNIKLPADSNFINARIERNHLYFLFENHLDIYRIGNEDGLK